MILLWLDDMRNPHESNWLSFSPIAHTEVIWVKSYNEFTKWIKKNGLPDGICFDHDLGKEAEQKLRDKGLTKKAARKLKAEEKTGMDCAKWLVEYCMDNQKELPLWNIQSSNPVGKINISSLLMNFNNKR